MTKELNARDLKSKKFYMNPGSKLILPEDPMEREFEKAKIEKEVEEAQKLFLALEKQKQAELEEKLKTLEILPTLNRVILLPYPANPYRKILDGNIIVDYTGDFNNPDSGEKDKLEVLVGCAKIIEVGPETKYIKIGDDVFYDTRTCYPVPFFNQGYLLTSEPQILCILNENLKARFNMN